MNSLGTLVEAADLQDVKRHNNSRSSRPLIETGAATFKICNNSKSLVVVQQVSAESQLMVSETHLTMTVTPILPRALLTELKNRRATILTWTGSQQLTKAKTL